MCVEATLLKWRNCHDTRLRADSYRLIDCFH